MPMQYKPGRNPYRYGYFGILKIGSNATPAQIVQQARKLCQELKAGVKHTLGTLEVDEHAVTEARAKLLDQATREEEVLLVHTPAAKDPRKLSALIDQLQELANLSPERPTQVLSHPLAVLWFLPAPGPDAVGLPSWEELGCSQAGDEQDLAMDIVFDR